MNIDSSATPHQISDIRPLIEQLRKDIANTHSWELVGRGAPNSYYRECTMLRRTHGYLVITVLPGIPESMLVPHTTLLLSWHRTPRAAAKQATRKAWGTPDDVYVLHGSDVFVPAPEAREHPIRSARTLLRDLLA